MDWQRFDRNKMEGYKRNLRIPGDQSDSFYLKRFMINSTASSLPFRENAVENEKLQRAPVWLISFTDLMALLLAFFVLTFSMSEPDEQKWPKLQGTLEKEFNKFEGPKKYEGGPEVITLTRTTYNRALNLDYLSALLKTKLGAHPALDEVQIFKQRDRLLLSFSNELLFKAGAADISDKGVEALKVLAPALSRIKNALSIVGHADPRTLGENSDYINNWQLSLARAFAVSYELKKYGYNKELPVTGYSSARYTELGDTMSEEKKLAMARRVDIVIMGDDGRIKNDLQLKLDN